jgi:hypothetical protein
MVGHNPREQKSTKPNMMKAEGEIQGKPPIHLSESVPSSMALDSFRIQPPHAKLAQGW